MSRIYFHSIDGDAEVLGPERAFAGNFCSELTLSVLGPIYKDRFDDTPPPILELLPSSCYVKSMWQKENRSRFEYTFETWFRVSTQDGYFVISGERSNNFAISLNTALVVGSDQVKLMARLHGQCELNTYIEGQNRAWLANIIEQGRKIGIFRNEMGWEGVVALLRKSDSSPVVTSYSVTEQFPNPYYADWPKIYEPDGVHYTIDETWYDLSGQEQWDKSIVGLRKNTFLEMNPSHWGDYYFENGITAFEVVEEAYKLANLNR